MSGEIGICNLTWTYLILTNLTVQIRMPKDVDLMPKIPEQALGE